MPAGNVGSWIQQAMQILQQHGVDTSKIDPRDIATMIKKESGGNPRAQNNWDSNAKKGTPSKGLMQTIQPTFDRYKLPGYGDVWNPVHNIVAAVRYSLARYGSISNVPGVKAMHAGGKYKGY
jgi:SLT domain-containing protein